MYLYVYRYCIVQRNFVKQQLIFFLEKTKQIALKSTGFFDPIVCYLKFWDTIPGP